MKTKYLSLLPALQQLPELIRRPKPLQRNQQQTLHLIQVPQMKPHQQAVSSQQPPH